MLTIPGKIPIRIHPLFWVLAGFIGWMSSQTVLGTVLWIVVILYSVLFHEFGHAVTALFFGQKADVTLYIAGGATQRHGPKLKLWQEFLVVLNGPLFGIALFFISYQILLALGDREISAVPLYMLTITAFVNLYWTLLNLLPVQPLDGGRLLTIILEGIFGVRGIKISYFIGMVLSALISVAFFMVGFLLPGALFLLLTFESYQGWKTSLSITPHDRDDGLQQKLNDAEAALQLGDFDKAYDKLTEILDSTDRGMLYLTATQYMADILTAKQRYKEAFELLQSNKSKLDAEHTYLLYQLAHKIEDWQTVIALGDGVYQTNPGYETATINALAYAVFGEVRPAIGWLKCAIRAGLPNSQEIMQRPEFDPIRQDQQFQKMLNHSD